eukprot:6212039-Pleurochrysis_carterae.AAC.4
MRVPKRRLCTHPRAIHHATHAVPFVVRVVAAPLTQDECDAGHAGDRKKSKPRTRGHCESTGGDKDIADEAVIRGDVAHRIDVKWSHGASLSE